MNSLVKIISKVDVSNKESCVRCGRYTDVNKDTLVYIRLYYIEGGGQLCKECYDKTYDGKNDEPDNHPPEY